MAELQLEAQIRELTGRKVRQLRTQGLAPTIVYGKKQAPINLQVQTRSLENVLHSGGLTQLVEVTVEGSSAQNVLIREVQRHPVTASILHADFIAVDMTEKQQISVPVTSTGTPEALVAGLMLLQAFDTVEVEALPSDIPASIEVDITALTLENSITIADMPAIDGVEYITAPDEAVFTMITTRIEEEEEEEELEIEEGMEPEVLTGKQDDEEED